ncbi:MAG: sec-independent protein secretion pathway component TatB [Phenylobacterium sp.]|nr:sec-independent protein secretion pathway component TatB [Phenylobacterium sp.]
MFPEGRALEFLLAAVVALIVVGPKDLPVLLRKLGQFMAKLRSMAAEFRASFDEMARQSELDELRKEVEAMRRGQLTDIAQSTRTELDKTFGDINQELTDVGVQLHPPMSYQYAEPTVEPEPVVAPKPKRRAPAAKAGAKTPAKAAAGKAPVARKTSAKAAAAPKPRARKTPERKA